MLIIIPAVAFASDVVITWEWMQDDPQVTGFRYQLDEENPDKWITVPSDTTSVTIQNLDGAMEHSLYLQQTYDGVNWSASAISVAYPLYTEEPTAQVEDSKSDMSEEMTSDVMAKEESAPVEEKMEEPVVTEETPTEEATEAPVMEDKMEMAAEEPADTMMKDEAKPSRYYTSFALTAGGQYSLAGLTNSTGTYNQISPAAGFSLGFNNIVSLGNSVGLGLNLDVDYLGYVTGSFKDALFSFFTSGTDFSMNVALVPEIEFDFGKFVIDLGAIADATLVKTSYVGAADLTPDLFDKVVLGYGGKLGLAYSLTDWMQLGLEGSFKKVGGYNLSNGSWAAGGKALFKFTF